MQRGLRHSGIGFPLAIKGGVAKPNGAHFLFWGKYSEISGGQMPNKITGATDYLTIAGVAGSETYQAPHNATYEAADTDYIWFKTDSTQRTTTTAELIGYDLQRTLVKYDDNSPYQIREIIILKAGETLTASERNIIFQYMWLPILWDNNLNAYGHIKGNRIGQNLWYPAIVLDGEPSTLTAVAETEAKINLAWINTSTTEDGFKIERGTDGINFSVIDTIGAGLAVYADTTVTTNLHYYYRVRAYKGTGYTEYTNIANEWAPCKLTFLTMGSGVADLKFTVITTNVTMTITNGTFYDNLAATLNAGTTRTITTGGIRTFYFKVPTVDGYILLFHKGNVTQMNHAYNTTTSPKLSMALSLLPRQITTWNINGLNNLTGTWADFPAGTTIISLSQANVITGAPSDIPSTVTDIYFQSTSSGYLSGACSGLPRGLLSINFVNYLLLTGTWADMPTGLLLYSTQSGSAPSGNISDWPRTLTYMYLWNITGVGTISGTCAQLPRTLTSLTSSGHTLLRLYGDVADLPTGLTTFSYHGYNAATYILSGNLASIPSGITYWKLIQFGAQIRINDYTSGRSWSNSVNYIYHQPSSSYGLDSTEVDNLLIDLANATWAGSTKTLNVAGYNAARTEASDAARTTLVGKGVTVTTS